MNLQQIQIFEYFLKNIIWDYPDGLFIDQNFMESVVTTRNSGTYWWERAFHVGIISVEDNLEVDIELGGCEGTQDGIDRGGKGDGL